MRILKNGKESDRCDAEIGHYLGWHSCRKPAHWKRIQPLGVTLHYCNAHKNHWNNPKYCLQRDGDMLLPIDA